MGTRAVSALILVISILCFVQAAIGDLPGDLHIVCEEEVSIFIDDELMGVTNKEDGGLLLNLLEGEYDIRAEKDRKVIYSSTVYVQGGETTVLSLDIK